MSTTPFGRDLAGIERLDAAIARETGRLGRAQIIEKKLARATLARHHEAFGQIPVRLDGAVQIAIRLLHHRERDAAPAKRVLALLAQVLLVHRYRHGTDLR